jgi:hypothetical protein
LNWLRVHSRRKDQASSRLLDRLHLLWVGLWGWRLAELLRRRISRLGELRKHIVVLHGELRLDLRLAGQCNVSRPLHDPRVLLYHLLRRARRLRVAVHVLVTRRGVLDWRSATELLDASVHRLLHGLHDLEDPRVLSVVTD